MSKIEVDTIEPQSGTSLTLGASGDTITIPSGATLDGSSATLTGIGTATVNGITVADQWRLTTNFTGDATPIASNLERVDGAGQGTLGTAMAESSGIFTFPSTGIWFVKYDVNTFHNTGNWYHTLAIQVTTNNSSYTTRASGEAWGTQAGEAQTFYTSGTANTLVDVTDTTQVKVRFTIDAFSGTATTMGSTNNNVTYMTFIRLGDT